MRLFKKANSGLKWLEIKIAAQLTFIPVKEIFRRFQQLGWTVRKTAKESQILSPDGIQQAIIPAHNWDRRWRESRHDVLKVNPDLKFVYDSPFKIPKGFNFNTQRIEEIPISYDEKVLNSINQIPANYQDWQILHNNEWDQLIDIDWVDKTMMISNGDIVPIPEGSIRIRKEI